MIKFINKLIRANEYRSLCEFADFYKIPGPPFYEYIYTNTITNNNPGSFDTTYGGSNITPEYLNEYIDRVFEYILNDSK